MDGCVDRLARGLRHAGLARGDRAAIIADNGPEWIAAALAVIRAGGVVVPLDVQLGEKALRHVFGDSTPRFVFTTKNRAERIVGVRKVRGSFCWTQQIKTSGVGGACF